MFQNPEVSLALIRPGTMLKPDGTTVLLDADDVPINPLSEPLMRYEGMESRGDAGSCLRYTLLAPVVCAVMDPANVPTYGERATALPGCQVRRRVRRAG